MATVKPSLAGPRRPQDRVLLEDLKANFHENLGPLIARRNGGPDPQVVRFEREGGGQPQAPRLAAKPVSTIFLDDCQHELRDGSVVIARSEERRVWQGSWILLAATTTS